MPPRRSAAEPANARSRGSIPSRPKPGKYPVIFDPRVSSSLLGHFAGAINGSSVARKTSFLADKLGERVFGRRRHDRRRSAAPARACARGRSTAKASASSRQELVAGGILNQWIADSAAARQLGIAPTGHAARGVGGAPGASAEQPLSWSRAPQPRGAARRRSRSGAGHRADRAGRERRHRRLQPRRRRVHGARRRDRRAGRRDHDRLKPRSTCSRPWSPRATSSSAAASTRRRSSFPK